MHEKELKEAVIHIGKNDRQNKNVAQAKRAFCKQVDRGTRGVQTPVQAHPTSKRDRLTVLTKSLPICRHIGSNQPAR